jgi:NAD(P)-dependent dehydrogenase (short-subunit alcohol dehydrogenase family)
MHESTAPPTPSELFSVAGKTALVTGGSRGIGLMIARGLVAAGARVAISSRKADVCAAVADELSQHGECVAIPADLSTRAGVEALAAAVREHFPDGLHLLVNNAGATWGAPLEDFPESGWDKVVDTNVKGLFELTTALLPALRATASADDPARVVNIGSIDGIRPPRTSSYPYSASKAAVHMLTRHLAKDLAAEAITVNAIAPGPFESRMMAFILDEPDARSALEQEVPLGRIGRPDDVVGAVLFLSSRAGGYVTGVVMPLDGGMVGCA